MNKDKRDLEYPVELESQFLLRLPEEPAKLLRELLKSGESLKNRLTIQIDNDMRHGEVNFDHRLMHAKIIDLPTIIESLKTIDNKSFYKTADICQMMICKDEPEQPSLEEDSLVKNKKRDSFKVDKKFLWPHGITPPTKNIRKRRFRKTLRKKCAEAPEIEKEVKRLLQADNEAVSVTWEVVKEEDDHRKPEKNLTNTKLDKKPKLEQSRKKDSILEVKSGTASNEVDIFGGAVSDSDLEEDNMEMEDSHFSAYDSRQSDTSSLQGTNDNQNKNTNFSLQFNSQMFNPSTAAKIHTKTQSSSDMLKTRLSSESYDDYQTQDNMNLRIEQLRSELEELKQRRQQTQQEISGMENIALRQRFQNTLHTLNQDIMYKEMEYQGLITLQNSEDI